MNGDCIDESWKQLTGKAKVQWGKLTDDDLDVNAGRREQPADKLREGYGIGTDEAEKHIGAWSDSAPDAWFYRPQDRT